MAGDDDVVEIEPEHQNVQRHEAHDWEEWLSLGTATKTVVARVEPLGAGDVEMANVSEVKAPDDENDVQMGEASDGRECVIIEQKVSDEDGGEDLSIDDNEADMDFKQEIQAFRMRRREEAKKLIEMEKRMQMVATTVQTVETNWEERARKKERDFIESLEMQVDDAKLRAENVWNEFQKKRLERWRIDLETQVNGFAEELRVQADDIVEKRVKELKERLERIDNAMQARAQELVEKREADLKEKITNIENLVGEREKVLSGKLAEMEAQMKRRMEQAQAKFSDKLAEMEAAMQARTTVLMQTKTREFQQRMQQMETAFEAKEKEMIDERTAKFQTDLETKQAHMLEQMNVKCNDMSRAKLDELMHAIDANKRDVLIIYPGMMRAKMEREGKVQQRPNHETVNVTRKNVHHFECTQNEEFWWYVHGCESGVPTRTPKKGDDAAERRVECVFEEIGGLVENHECWRDDELETWTRELPTENQYLDWTPVVVKINEREMFKGAAEKWVWATLVPVRFKTREERYRWRLLTQRTNTVPVAAIESAKWASARAIVLPVRS